MQFEVETGQGQPTANSYVDYDFADQYCALYSLTDWLPESENTPEVIQQKRLALMQATQSIDLLYGSEFKSRVLRSDQALEFPRVAFMMPNNKLASQVPELLKRAVVEVAVMAVQGKNIFPDKNQLSSIKSESKQVGEVQKQAEYFEPATNEELLGFYKVEQFLRPLFKTTAFVGYLGR